MVDVPTHRSVLAIGVLVHDVAELVHSVKVGILTVNHLAFVPNLVNAILSKIAHRQFYSSVTNVRWPSDSATEHFRRCIP